MKNCLLPLATLGLAAAAGAQVSLRPLATVNLDSTANSANPEFIGSNPSCVAWNGTDLYVGGFNSSGSAGTTGVVKVSDALNSASIQAAFVQYATNSLRGFSGLDVNGQLIAAAFDNGGAVADGITLWDSRGGQRWAKNARGGSGVGFDPGFSGADSGVAWTTFGSGRRALQDTTTGADIYTTGNGMIILTSAGTFWRDIDFDDSTGDVYLREGNNVIKWTRNGGNSVTGSQLLFDPTDADFVNTQNLAFVRLNGEEIVFFNDRSMTSGGQEFGDVVRVIDSAGNALAVDWGGFAPAAGVGAYDFSWDAASGTLALLDFSNRDVTIFDVSVDCAGLSTTGDGSPGSTLTFDLVGADASAPAALVLSPARGSTALPIGSLGTLELALAQPLLFLSLGTTSAAGDVSLGLTVPNISPRVELPGQAFTVTFSALTGLDFCVSNVVTPGVGQ